MQPLWVLFVFGNIYNVVIVYKASLTYIENWRGIKYEKFSVVSIISYDPAIMALENLDPYLLVLYIQVSMYMEKSINVEKV